MRHEFGTITECAGHLAKRLTSLAFRLGHHQVGKPFHFGEVELAIFKCAACEFSGLSRTKTFNLRKRSEHGGNDRAATMQLELRYILAGFAVGRRKPQRKRLIDELAATSTNANKRRLTRGRGLARQSLKRRAGARAGYAHHAYRRRHPAGGQRVYGVVDRSSHRGARKR